VTTERTASSEAVAPGDAVRWRRITRGAYGYMELLPAVVVRVSAKRVRVAVLRKDDTIHQVSVTPSNIVIPQEWTSASLAIVDRVRSKLPKSNHTPETTT
jgi:hypothetical protein